MVADLCGLERQCYIITGIIECESGQGKSVGLFANVDYLMGIKVLSLSGLIDFIRKLDYSKDNCNRMVSIFAPFIICIRDDLVGFSVGGF